MGSKNDNYIGIVLEDIRDQNRAVLEAVGQMHQQMKRLASQESVDNLAADMRTIKAVITATNKDLASHDKRITKVEQAILS